MSQLHRRNLYRNNPCKMASFLLGNEGKGSAYASLQVFMLLCIFC